MLDHWKAWDMNALAMYDTIAAYMHGPAIEPDRIVNLDGRTRVYHGQPRPYVQRYPNWPPPAEPKGAGGVSTCRV